MEMNINEKPKILVVLGPTASGKSDLAVDLALLFNGEVISADSRQIFKGLDIGTGKITKEEMRGIPHHLLDIREPNKRYSVINFQKDARKAIEGILNRNKLPILCGGTGYYIWSVTENISFPQFRSNEETRKKLENKNEEELLKELSALDPAYAEIVDSQNKRKLTRAIELAQEFGKVPKLKKNPYINALQIGIETEDDILKKRIHDRLIRRIEKEGMIDEAKNLHKDGLSYKRMDELGLEYRYLALYLKGTITLEEMIKELDWKIWQYARRQKTWFKRDKRIKWFELNQKEKIENEVRRFI